MFLTILSVVAQFESDVSRERTADAKMELAVEGKFPGNNIPAGLPL
jgi:DNA invertase Pin-like site-specific DNA recombinase